MLTSALRRAALLGIAILCLVGLTAHAGAEPAYPTADPDPFYHSPANLAQLRPGEVVRVRPVDTSRHLGSRGWQVAFRSTNSGGAPIVAVTTVMIPLGVVNPPLLSYQGIINSLGATCAPSHTLFGGVTLDASVPPLALAQGWAISMPDHTGPAAAYGAARLGGMITLDSVRAVRQVHELGLATSPVVLAGYSGGGMASAWAGALAPSYAPELALAGVVSGGVPSDMQEMVAKSDDLFGLAFAAGIGLEREYPQRFALTPHLSESGLRLRSQLKDKCQFTLMFEARNYTAAEVAKDGETLLAPEAQAVLTENSLRYFDGVPQAPVLVTHDLDDGLTPYSAMADVVARYCAAAVPVQVNTYRVGEHVATAAVGLPDTMAWVSARFRGEPAPSNC